MASGLQIFFGNDSTQAGLLQIDENYINFHLRKSGVIKPIDWKLVKNFSYDEGGGKLKEFAINVKNFNEPTIVLKPLGDYTTASAVSQRINITTGEPEVVLNIWHNYEPNADVEYYIFDNYTPPIDSLGIELRNAANQTVYHSSWYRMRVVGSHILPKQKQINEIVDLDIPLSIRNKKLGLMLPPGRVAMQKGLYDYATLLKDCVYFKSSSQISVYKVAINAGSGWWNPMTGFWNWSPLLILYVDVSDYPTNYNADAA